MSESKDAIPELFARWVRVSLPMVDELPENEVTGRWKHLTGPAERRFWHELDSTRAAVTVTPGPDAPAGGPLAVLAAELRAEAGSAPAGSVGFAVSQVKYKIAARIERAAAAPAAPLPKVHAHPQDEAEKWLAETWETDDANAVGYDRSDMIDAYHSGWLRYRKLAEAAVAAAAPSAPQEPQAVLAAVARLCEADALPVSAGVLAAQVLSIIGGEEPPQPAPELAAARPGLGTAWRLLDEARSRLAITESELAITESEIDRVKNNAQLKLDSHRAEIGRLRELLDEVGVMAANAPEDGDSFGLLEEIAMRIAGHGMPEETTPDGAS